MSPENLTARRVLTWTALLFSAVTFTISWWHWWTFQYGTFDLAFYVQSLWLALRGKWMVSLLNVPLGGTVTFSATLTNTGTTPLFLNGDSVTVAPPVLPNDLKFFLNFPLFLSAGQSVTAPILDVTAPTVPATFGLRTGSMSILGGANANELTTQASQTFAVNVVPEPGGFTLLLVGLSAFGWARRRG